MKENQIIKDFLTIYGEVKNHNLFGRYITADHILPELEKLSETFVVTEVGSSVRDIPIHSVTLGSGPVKILAWSQMHGNESTTTKALFDIFNFFREQNRSGEVSRLLNGCTLRVIPMLNPDGSFLYTRENANGVDLNRDADAVTQKESQVLRTVFEEYNPDFCFNLHDQRTIFSAGAAEKPATLSFLAPAMDEERSVNEIRKKTMKVIADINVELQNYLPGQMGRYDDAFNINCTGDRYMASGIPTLLFEAGHYHNDYMREETRKYMAAAILKGLHSVSTGTFENHIIVTYQEIPENQKNFFDIILREALVRGEICDVAIQYRESVSEGRINFDPVIIHIAKELDFFAHRIIECRGNAVTGEEGKELSENDIVEGILLNTDNITFKIE